MRLFGLLAATVALTMAVDANASTVRGDEGLDCSDVQLQSARHDPVRNVWLYDFAGTCIEIYYHTVERRRSTTTSATEQGRVFIRASASWNGADFRADEAIEFGPDGEDGEYQATFNCSADPFAGDVTCTTINMATDGGDWPALLNRMREAHTPFLTNLVTSEDQASAETADLGRPPPPPPPPAAGPAPSATLSDSANQTFSARVPVTGEGAPVVRAGDQPTGSQVRDAIDRSEMVYDRVGEAPTYTTDALADRDASPATQTPSVGSVVVAGPQIVGDARVIEAEAVIGEIGVENGPAPGVQNMSGWGSQWSGGEQVFFAAPDAGAELVIPLGLVAAGWHDVTVYMTQAPDYGGATLHLEHAYIRDGQTRGCTQGSGGFDGYASDVSGPVEVRLGWLDSQGGPVTLHLRVAGKNPQSTGHFLGVDRIVLDPDDLGPVLTGVGDRC